MIRICLVDDNPLYLQCLVAILEETDGFEIVATHTCAEEARRTLGEHPVDILLTDIRMPGEDGAALIEWTAVNYPSVVPVALTSFADRHTVNAVLQSGAKGYLLKGERREVVVSALKSCGKGGMPVSPKVASLLVGRFHAEPAAPYALTTREAEILRYATGGKTFREASELTGMTVDEVGEAMKSIYRKSRLYVEHDPDGTFAPQAMVGTPRGIRTASARLN